MYVPGEGPSTSKLVVVGDRPTAEDYRNKRAFSGVAGRQVREFLNEAGFDHRGAYYTYVYKSPPLPEERKAKVLPPSPQFHEEMNILKPNCILALGNIALEKLTGNKGIKQFRGSILNGIHGKVVPTLHPYSLYVPDADGKMLDWRDSKFIQWDFNRAVEQSKFPEYNVPRRNLSVARSDLDLYRFLEMNKSKPYVSVDIETFKTIPICIGFAFDRYSAMSVPLFNLPDYNLSPSQLREIWMLVAKLMGSVEVMKIGQNFKFDERQLYSCYNGTQHFGIKTRGFFFDTHLGFKTMFPEFAASLQFIASVLTEEPYYKEEGKGYNPKKDKTDRLLLYNAKDAVVTYECFEEEVKWMQSTVIYDNYTVYDFFMSFVMPLHPFYSRIEQRGILRDPKVQKEIRERYLALQDDKQRRLNELTKDYLDKPVNVQSVSPKGDVPFLLYEAMKLPRRKGTDEKTLDALVRNTVKDPKKKEILELILEIRKIRKTIGTYIDAAVDYRGRLCTQYRIPLETGRTSTSILKPPVTTEKMGLAFQTVTKHGDVGSDIREYMIPDPGYVFVESDLSQAEARVVAILANDEKLQKMFEYSVDVHRVTTGWIIGGCPNELLDLFFKATDKDEIQCLTKEINRILKGQIDNESRQLGKKFRHAGHYDMKKREASMQAGVSEWKADQILTGFHQTNPKIRGVFHKEIVDALQHNNRILVTPHGRRRQFMNKWGEDLFKEAYANIPQGTVSDHLKESGIHIARRMPKFMIVQEAHDSILGLCPLDRGAINPFKYLDKLVDIIREELTRPIDFRNCTLSRGELVIPCDISVGEKTWKEMLPHGKFRNN